MNFATDAFEFDQGESFIDELNVIDNFEQFKEELKTRNSFDAITEMEMSISSEIMLYYIVKTFGVKLFLKKPTGKYKGNLIEAKSYFIGTVDGLNEIGLNENSILYDVKYVPSYPKLVNGIPSIVNTGYWRIRVA